MCTCICARVYTCIPKHIQLLVTGLVEKIHTIAIPPRYLCDTAARPTGWPGGTIARGVNKSTQRNSLLNCVLRCPLSGPISCGGNFWCSPTMVITTQFFTKLCTKMSTFGANLVEAISGARQQWSTQGNSLLNCVRRCHFRDQSRVEAISGARQPWSTQSNSLKTCLT